MRGSVGLIAVGPGLTVRVRMERPRGRRSGPTWNAVVLAGTWSRPTIEFPSRTTSIRGRPLLNTVAILASGFEQVLGDVPQPRGCFGVQRVGRDPVTSREHVDLGFVAVVEVAT